MREDGPKDPWPKGPLPARPKGPLPGRRAPCLAEVPLPGRRAPCLGSTMLTNLVAALEIRVSVEARQIEYVIFWKAPSIGVVYLVPETGNLALAEPGAM